MRDALLLVDVINTFEQWDGDPGFKVSVLVDACAAVDERMERISLEDIEDLVGVRLERSDA